MDLRVQFRETLQWGRVTDDAEIRKLPTLIAVSSSLQWGRVTDDAEIRLSRTDIINDDLLQWGRVTDDAETFIDLGAAFGYE